MRFSTVLLTVALILGACSAPAPVETGRMGMNGTAGVGPAGTQFHGGAPTPTN